MKLTHVKPIGLGSVMLAVLRREISLAMRQKGEVLTPLVFFAVVASLFPLGVGPESALLLRMAPGVLWVSALLAAMLSLQRLFASDYADGFNEGVDRAQQTVSRLAPYGADGQPAKEDTTGSQLSVVA